MWCYYSDETDAAIGCVSDGIKRRDWQWIFVWASRLNSLFSFPHQVSGAGEVNSLATV